jgi:hypothetical protein
MAPPRSRHYPPRLPIHRVYTETSARIQGAPSFHAPGSAQPVDNSAVKNERRFTAKYAEVAKVE